MKSLIVIIAFIGSIFTAGCQTLRSGTTIKPQDSFVLGNNEHGKFTVNLKNTSKQTIEVYHAPINGGKHSSQMVEPNQSVKVKVDKNTALIFGNQSMDTVTIALKVNGDLGLSMGYKN